MSAGTKDSQYFKSFNFQAKSAHATGLTLSFFFLFVLCFSGFAQKSCILCCKQKAAWSLPRIGR